MDNIKRLQQLSGIDVADELVPDDELDAMKDREYDEKQQLEKTIGKTILDTFKKIGFDVLEADYGTQHDGWTYDVYYDLDSGEGQVKVDGCTAKQVSVLQTSGLADEYKLYSSNDGIRIEFIVSSNLVNSLKHKK